VTCQQRVAKKGNNCWWGPSHGKMRGRKEKKGFLNLVKMLEPGHRIFDLQKMVPKVGTTKVIHFKTRSAE